MATDIPLQNVSLHDDDNDAKHYRAHNGMTGIREFDGSTSGDDTPPSGEAQGGVQAIEAISKTWTFWGLIAAYLSIFLMACSTSLEGQTTYSVVSYVTSSFGEHSLISTVYVVGQIVNAVVKAPLAKIADVFGRLEAFTLCVLLVVLGYIQMAVSTNVQTYASAQIFYAAGGMGLQTLQQIFIADTSDMLNRALFSSLPDVPFLFSVWVGPLIGAGIMADTGSWRWAYGIWCIILPACFLPMCITLFLNLRKAKKMGLVAPRKWSWSPLRVLKSIWLDLDLGGMILLSAGFALILLPLTIASQSAQGFQSPDIIAMLVIGFVCLLLLPLWEWRKSINIGGTTIPIAPHPLIPLNLLKSPTFCLGCAVGFFYFMAYYLSVQPYLNSYLQVVQFQSIVTAGYVTQTFSFTSTVASVVISIVIKYTKHYKYFVTAGAAIYLLGMGLMIRYRTQDASVGSLVGTQIAVGIGGGMINVPAQLGIQASCSHQQVAAGTAVFLTLVEIGGAVGSAISGAVWGHLIPAKLDEYLPDAAKDQALTIYGNLTVATGFPMGSPERIAINRAYDETMHSLLTIAVCMCVPILIASALMRNYRLDEMEQGVKGRVLGGAVGNDEKKESTRHAPNNTITY